MNQELKEYHWVSTEEGWKGCHEAVSLSCLYPKTGPALPMSFLLHISPAVINQFHLLHASSNPSRALLPPWLDSHLPTPSSYSRSCNDCGPTQSRNSPNPLSNSFCTHKTCFSCLLTQNTRISFFYRSHFPRSVSTHLQTLLEDQPFLNPWLHPFSKSPPVFKANKLLISPDFQSPAQPLSSNLSTTILTAAPQLSPSVLITASHLLFTHSKQGSV